MSGRQTISAKYVAAQHLGRRVSFTDVLGENVSGSLNGVRSDDGGIVLTVASRSIGSDYPVIDSTPIYFD